jgi:hypothetical protein
MEVASQGRVGPEGGGEATVFDTSAFYTNMYNIQKDIMAERKKKQDEIKQQQQTWNALLEDPGDVWQADFEYVNKAVNEYNDFIIDLRSKGINPNNMDPQLLRKMKALESNIRKTTSAAKDNEAYSIHSFKILNDDKANKYNKGYASQWLKDYADPTKTPQDRAKMRVETNPFKINYDIDEFVEKTVPEPAKKDTGRKSVTYRDKNAHKALVLGFIMSDPSGQEVFESLKKDGEDEDAFAERVATLGQLKYPEQEDLQVAPTRGSASGGGGGTKKEKIEIIAEEKVGDTKWNQQYDVNAVSLGEKKPPVKVISSDETPVAYANFVPDEGFYLRPDNTIAVKGRGRDDKSVEVDVEIDYTKNKRVFDAAGYPDMYDYFVQRIWGGARKGKTTNPNAAKGKTETPAERAARIANGG